jgi:hypothetical protein
MSERWNELSPAFTLAQLHTAFTAAHPMLGPFLAMHPCGSLVATQAGRQLLDSLLPHVLGSLPSFG